MPTTISSERKETVDRVLIYKLSSMVIKSTSLSTYTQVAFCIDYHNLNDYSEAKGWPISKEYRAVQRLEARTKHYNSVIYGHTSGINQAGINQFIN